MNKSIFAPNLPAVGPYAHAVLTGNTLYTSGQIPFDPIRGELVTGSIETQTRQVFANLKAVLNVAGFDFCHVVKATVFLTDITAHFVEVNQVYAEMFPESSLPARSCVQVAALPMGAQVEVELIAVK